MPAHRNARWTSRDVAILHDVFPREGINGAADALPDRSWQAINVKASKLGLRSPVVGDAPKPRLRGAELEEAIRLREVESWSFGRIAATFGVAESSACNAVLIALCPRRGYVPAQRDSFGRLTDEGHARLRFALKKGLKGVDIQLRLGVSASCVAEQRRRYRRDLKERGKAELPPPGAGEAYSGIKLSKAQRVTVEALYNEGLGSKKVSERTGVSLTSCTRIRNRLIKRLQRKGESLPGCDTRGVRHTQAESSRFIPEELKCALRALLLERIPVSRAARLLAIGGCSAYRIRDQLAAELAAAGQQLPRPILPGSAPSGSFETANWPPIGPPNIYRFRAMLREMPFDRAKERYIDERRAQIAIDREASRPKTFDEQLDAVRSGRLSIMAAFNPRQHLQPRFAESERCAR